MNITNKLKSFLAILIFLLSSSIDASDDLHNKRLLVLNSYDPLFPTYERRMQGLLSVFAETQVNIDIEYMDSKRHFDAKSQQLFLALLRQKVDKKPAYDVIITSDDNALNLVLEYQHQLFPGTPVVFTGLNNESLAKELTDQPGVTGVVETISARRSLELIGSIKPHRKYLHVVVDSTPSGQADLQRVLKAAANTPSSLEIIVIDLTYLSWAVYKERLKRLGVQDSVLLLSAFRDRTGSSVSFQETLETLNLNAQVPVYHLWEHGLGQGILGGVLINQFEQGQEAALMAKKILTGTNVDKIPELIESTLQPMFDFNQLKRHNIQFSTLPDDAQIFFKPESIWDQYLVEICAVTVAFLLLITLALYLAHETLIRSRLASQASKQNSFLRSLMNTVPDLIWLKDPKGYFLACNRQFESLYGASEADIIGKTDFDFVEPEIAQSFQLHDQRAMQSDQACRNEETVTFKSDGREAQLETIKTPLKQANGDLIGILGISRDITERVLAEQKIRKLMRAMEQSPVSVMICSPAGRVEYVNYRFEFITGYKKSEIQGRKPRFLQRGMMSNANYEAVWQALEDKQSWQGEFRNKKKNGETLFEYIQVSPIFSDKDILTGFIVVIEDITLRRQQEEKIRVQAHFDTLTTLPNRILSQDRLSVMMAQAKRSKSTVGVFYIDLDDFKKVNDTLGHETGDRLLVQVAQRLAKLVRECDTVGRLGGDEFILLINSMQNHDTARTIATQIIETLEKPVDLDGRSLLISGSIGIACYPQDADKVTDLMRKADLAMYNAKHKGGSCFAFYTKQLNDVLERRFLVEEQLRNALCDNQLYLVYQPKIDLRTGKLKGFEALLRWQNPRLGSVCPSEFIPLAEQMGIIINIGYFVVEQAFALLQVLSDQGHHDISMAINLSPRQFRDEQLHDKLFSLVKQYDIKPQQVEFEITEGLLIDDFPGVKEKLNKLHDFGISLAMDDFGTGYSSLSYLRHYPFDTLKIDQEFIQGITNDKADYELVNAAISMAHGLGLALVAEGVETNEQKNLLQQLGCDIGQGYLFAKPMQANQVTEYVAGSQAC